MTQYQLTLDSETVQRLFTGDGQLGRLLEAVLNQVLNAQVSEQLQVAPYERSEQRQGYRNGYKPRQLTTRVGALTLLVPQVRDGQFSTELFARYQRSEQALVLDAHGTGGQRGLDPQSRPHHRGVMRDELCQVHRLRPV